MTIDIIQASKSCEDRKELEEMGILKGIVIQLTKNVSKWGRQLPTTSISNKQPFLQLRPSPKKLNLTASELARLRKPTVILHEDVPVESIESGDREEEEEEQPYTIDDLDELYDEVPASQQETQA